MGGGDEAVVGSSVEAVQGVFAQTDERSADFGSFPDTRAAPGDETVAEGVKEGDFGATDQALGSYLRMPGGKYIHVSANFASILEYDSPEDLLSCVSDMGGQLYVDPERRMRGTHAAEKKGTCSFEVLMYTKTGRTKWVSENFRAVRDETGAVIHYEGFIQDITERKRAEEIFCKAFQSSPSILALISLDDCRFVAVNENFVQFTGYQSSEVIGLTPVQLSILDNLSTELSRRTIRARGSLQNMEGRCRRKTGELVHFTYSAKTVEIAGGSLLLVWVSDATERKRQESEIHRRNDLLVRINEILTKAPKCETLEEIAAMTLSEVMERSGSEVGIMARMGGKDVFDIISVQDRSGEDRATSKAVAEWVFGEAHVGRKLANSASPLMVSNLDIAYGPDSVPEGPLLPEFLLGVPLRLGGDSVGAVLLARNERNYTLRDAEEVRAMSAPFAEALNCTDGRQVPGWDDEAYRMLLEGFEVGAAIVNAEGRFVFVNSAFLELAEYPLQWWKGKSVWGFVPPGDRKFHRKRFEAALRGEKVKSIELALCSRSGQKRWIEETPTLIGRPHGAPGLLLTFIDVTRRRHAEEELKEYRDRLDRLNGLLAECTAALETSERSYRSFVENAPIGVYTTTLKGEVLFVNNAGLRMLGFDPTDELMSATSPLRYKRSEDREDIIKILLSGGVVTDYEVEFETKTGRSIHILLNASLQGVEINGTMIDITSRKIVEAMAKEFKSRFQSSEEKHRNMVESGFVAVAEANLNGDILFANKTFSDMLNYASPEEVTKINLGYILADSDAWSCLVESLKEQSVKRSAEIALTTKSGGVLVCVAVFTLQGDTITCMMTDTADRMRLEIELKTQTDRLQEALSALKVLLDSRKSDRQDMEEGILANTKNLILPHIESLKGTYLTSRQAMLVQMIKDGLDKITSPFLTNMNRICSDLTPGEIRVAKYVRDGLSGKEIANILGISENSVNFHRQNIRGKVGLKNAGTNLRSFLLSLMQP